MCKNTIYPTEPYSLAKEVGTQRNWHTKFSGPWPRGETALRHANRAGKTLCAPRFLRFFPHKSPHKELAHKVFFGPMVVKKVAVKNFVCLSWSSKRQEKTPEFEIILPRICSSSTHLSVDENHLWIPPWSALMLYQIRYYHNLM